MSHWQARELHSLLLGTGPYPRDGAPEPVLLSLLAPMLPPDLLDKAADVARSYVDKGISAFALHSLALCHTPDTPQYLSLLDEAFRTATSQRRTGNSIGRAEILARLAPDLPLATRELALNSALADALSQSNMEVLETIAPLLSTDQHRQALRYWIKGRRDFFSSDLWVGLSALVHHLPSEIVPEAFAAAKAQKQRREAYYDALSPRLSLEQFEEILQDVARMGPVWASDALARLAHNLPEKLVEAALALTRTFPAEEQDEVHAALALRLADLGRHSDAIALVRKVANEFKAAKALAAMAPLLTSQQAVSAHDAAWHLNDEVKKWIAVSRLAPVLPESQRTDAVRRALNLAIKVAPLQGGAYWVAEELEKFATALTEAEAGQAFLLIEALSQSKDPFSRTGYVAAIVDLLPVLPRQLRNALEEGALAVARDQRLVSERCAYLTALVPALTERRRDDVLRELLSQTAQLERHKRQDIVEALFDRIDSKDRNRLLGAALSIETPTMPVIWASLRSRLHELLSSLDTLTKRDILLPVLDALQKRGRKRLKWQPPLALPPSTDDPPQRTFYRRSSLFYWLQMSGHQGEGGGGGEGLAKPEPLEFAPVPPRPPDDRVINTGFAPAAAPMEPLDPDRTLEPGAYYAFWFEIGPLIARSIESEPIPPPQNVPAEAVLTVALFGFGEFKLLGLDFGEIRIGSDGTSIVLRQPSDFLSVSSGGRRLVFPIRAPKEPGRARLRCCLYFEQILLQSRLVEVEVGANALTEGERPMRSVVDYALVHDFRPEWLHRHRPYRMSALLNANGNGSHSLRIVADDGGERRKLDLRLDGQSLSDQINQAREALRQAAWGSRTPWTNEPFKYQSSTADYEQFKKDVLSLAVCGYRLYHLLARAYALATDQPVPSAADELSSLVRKPGFIQLALKESPRHLLPLGLLYDYPLDTNAVELDLCRQFTAALSDGRDLVSAPCFVGDCPQAHSAASKTVVCPSGFWGFRHMIGLPLTVAHAGDVPAALHRQDQPCVRGGVYKPFRFASDHQDVLARQWNVDCRLGDTRSATIASLKGSQPQVVYFYCHGGINNSVPYIRVGGKDELGIAPDNLFNERICWQEARPLIFINGCETTALDPERAIEFVSVFVIDAWASGVIGTEITICEEMARPFAEHCLRSFLVDRLSIGEAVRLARLHLLKDKNPLGLVYVPFVLPTLQLEAPGGQATVDATLQ